MEFTIAEMQSSRGPTWHNVRKISFEFGGKAGVPPLHRMALFEELDTYELRQLLLRVLEEHTGENLSKVTTTTIKVRNTK